MKWLFNKIQEEPAAFFGGIGQILAAIIPALIVFDIIDWTDKQTAGLMFVVGVTIRFLTIMFTRRNVVPIEIANSQIKTAIQMPMQRATDAAMAEVIAIDKEKRDELSS